MVKKGFGIAGMLGEPRSGYGGGGPLYSTEDYSGGLLSPFRPGGNKPGLSDYDDDVWDFDYIEIPMSGSMKKMKKKKSKKRKDKAEGGLSGLLGERSGYQGGGATSTNALVKELYDAAGGFDGTGKSFSEFMADVLFEGDYLNKAQGGRIGLAEGDTPSEAWMRDYFYKSGLDRSGVITLDDYMRGPKGLGWKDYKEHGPGKAKGGRIGAGDGYKPGDFEKFNKMKEEPKIIDPLLGVDLKLLKELLDSGMDADEARIKAGGKAQGGRIGFKDGRGIMSRVGDMVDVRNVPYYSGKGLQGLVNSAETLSKFPLAAGELGSKLLRQKPKKEMFMEAIENITPGSWSENLGLTSLVEGMEEKRPEDAQTVGGILGLGTEIAVPTGGAFKAGQFLLNKASKAMGKVKDGKTLNKLVEDKISDSGQSRRDFNIMAATSGLMVALKSLGLGGILKGATKKSDDIEIMIRGDADYEYIDEAWSGGT